MPFFLAIYRMPHSPHICLALRFCHILEYNLCFGYLACCCICFAIIVFYRSEIYTAIFTLSSTMSSVLHILSWSIIGLRCLFLLIRICVVAMLALIPVDITASQVKPTLPSVLHILRWSVISLRCFSLLIRIHIVAILTLIPVDIPGSQVKPVTPLVLQVYFRDHKGSLDNPNMDTRSELMKYHSDFLIGSIFRICSPIGTVFITLPSYQ